MSGVFYLCNIFKFVIHGFYDCSFPEQQFVGNGHQRPSHVVFSLVTSYMPSTNSLWNRFLLTYTLSLINFPYTNSTKALYSKDFRSSTSPGCYHKIQKFPFLIANQVQLEAEEPAHRAFPSLGYALEHLMDMYPLVATDTKRCAVDKADFCAFAQKHFLDEQSQGYSHVSLKFYKMVV